MTRQPAVARCANIARRKKIYAWSANSADGSPRSEDAVNQAFAAATAAATGHVVVYLTHGTKTGLIAPVAPPRAEEVQTWNACLQKPAPMQMFLTTVEGLCKGDRS